MRVFNVAVLAMLLAVAAPANAAKQKADGATASAKSCPCSGSKLCVGPRGGKFCRTSSGSKRYQR